MRDPTLRCLAEGRDGDWFAICIDLDIAVQGQSFPEVRDSLSEAIKLYLERVAELPEHERVRLLNRRSPWPIRAKFELNWLLSKLCHNDDRSGRRRPFTLAPHLAT